MLPSSTPSFAPVATNNVHDQASPTASRGVIELSEATPDGNGAVPACAEHDGGPAAFRRSSSSNAAAAAAAIGEEELSGDDPVHSSSSHSLLSMRQAAALLTADCLGTGLLALPQNVWVLGRTVGLGFLILNLPINWYAGALLSRAALHVEAKQQQEDQQANDMDNTVPGDDGNKDGVHAATATILGGSNSKNGGRDGIMRKRSRRIRAGPSYSTIQQQQSTDHDVEDDLSSGKQGTDGGDGEDPTSEHSNPSVAASSEAAEGDDDDQSHSHHDVKRAAHVDTDYSDEEDEPTHDFIGLTRCLFPHPRATQFQPRATHLVIAVFYTNIFLVLGDYILVMSHAVAALLEDRVCLPWAGILASTLMFGLSQLRTMAGLGHSVTALSLTSLAVVVVQCLVADQEHAHDPSYVPPYAARQGDSTTIRKLSALASIMFATGPNKLVLNIRNEMKHKEECPQTLGLAVTIYGVVYVAIVLLAGPTPPSFLFDSIPEGTSRQIAGLLLWAHVAVSYAINSQAICSSIDRLFLQNIQAYNLHYHPRRRWFLMTLVLSLSSYFVANAVPFFKDLLALIGALTSVPLALTLPVVLHRRVWNIPIWVPTLHSLASYAILICSLVFLFVGLVGALGSIELDWSQQGTPFACTV